MTIFDKLKTLFEAKFGDLFSGNTVKFDFSKNVTNVLELKGDKLGLDVNKATPEEKLLIKKEIIDSIVQEKKDIFLIDKSSEKTKQIKKNLPTETDIELLKFYKDKLPPNMFKALEASLIVSNSFKNGEDITELKRDIARKYPELGNNLCNLVSSGYFGGHFKDLYNSMLEDEEFDIGVYSRKVKKIVKSLPYTVFVTKYKSYEELSGEVSFKLEKLRKYGTGRLLLHGLGKVNVTTTLHILEDYKDDGTVQIETEMNINQTIIMATLKFK